MTTNNPVQGQFAECATHTPTNLQNYNSARQQESQPGHQNETSTGDANDERAPE
jgi:hypothetical protein